eukprot:9699_1
MSKFEKIDKGLKIYYKRLGRNDYKNNEDVGKFLEYCNENGLEEVDIDDELNGDPLDCIYLEFDEDFPFEQEYDEDTQKQKIFEIIKQCYEHGEPDLFDSQLNIIQKQFNDM